MGGYVSKLYSILHIPTGNYIFVELYGGAGFNEDFTVENTSNWNKANFFYLKNI